MRRAAAIFLGTTFLATMGPTLGCQPDAPRWSVLLLTLDTLRPDHLSLELDTGWWAAVGRDPVAGVHGWGRRVRRMHLKDLVAGQDPPWVDVGDGSLDVAGVLGAARAHGVPWVIVEHDTPRDPIATLRRSAATALGVLGRS